MKQIKNKPQEQPKSIEVEGKDERFELAVKKTFGEEGGLSNHKLDKGGITQYGISLRFLRAEGIDVDGDGDVDANDILILTKGQAEQIYYKFFWKKINCNRIENDKLAFNVFDTAVNCGTPIAIILLQRVLKNFNPSLKIDGVLGEKTLASLAKEDPILINNHYKNERIAHYEGIVARDATQKVFLNGWRNRANKFA